MATGEGRAQVQGTLDGVLARLVGRDAASGRGIGARGRGADQIERLADTELDAQLVEDRLGIGGRAAQQDVGVDEREVADEDGHAVSETPGGTAPRSILVLAREPAVDRVSSAPDVGAVHDVVVHERERVHELESRRGVDRGRVVDRPARSDVRARAERGPQTLAAGGDEILQRAERVDERGIHCVPAIDLRGEQRVDALLDAVGNRLECLGKRGGSSRRAGHGERLRRGLRGFPIVSRPSWAVACAAVAAFLSDEWIRDLALACEGAPVPTTASDTGRFVIEPAVTGVPDLGEVRYRIAFEAGTCAVELASEGSPRSLCRSRAGVKTTAT